MLARFIQANWNHVLNQHWIVDAPVVWFQMSTLACSILLCKLMLKNECIVCLHQFSHFWFPKRCIGNFWSLEWSCNPCAGRCPLRWELMADTPNGCTNKGWTKLRKHPTGDCSPLARVPASSNFWMVALTTLGIWLWGHRLLWSSGPRLLLFCFLCLLLNSNNLQSSHYLSLV